MRIIRVRSYRFGCVGAGAVGGATVLPKLRAKLDINRLVLLGALGTAAAMACLGAVHSQLVAAAAALLAGASWITVLSSLQVSAQTALPNWVRARGLSLFLMAFFGAMSGGAVLWGLIAENLGVAAALLISSGGLALAAVVTLRIRLVRSDGSEHAPSLHWPAPPIVTPEDADAGPVMVTVDYRVEPARAAEFHRLIAQLRHSRLRDGAFAWSLSRPLEEGGILRETFMLHSWLDHVRQHERVTESDQRLQEQIQRLLQSGEAPLVRHHLPATTSALAGEPTITGLRSGEPQTSTD